MLKSEILTPALLLDLDAFEANLARMMERVKSSGKALRPHAKAHKCVEIAKRQLAAGACGVCVATLAEAELMSTCLSVVVVDVASAAFFLAAAFAAAPAS